MVKVFSVALVSVARVILRRMCVDVFVGFGNSAF